MNNAVVFGYGYVGKGTALAFGITSFYTRHESNITFEEAAKCKYIFICLPTPTIDGKCFTDDIEQLLLKLSSLPAGKDAIYIIRSTVTPGFADRSMESLGIKIASNPEFLSESTWEEDAKKPQIIVIGANDPKVLADVKALYMGRYKYMQPVVSDNKTAELIKYAVNTLFATKTIFTNEIYDVAQEIKANYEIVRQALESHPWGMKNHTQAVYKGKRGIHGRCLPKDLWTFAEFSKSPFFTMLMERNGRFI